MFFKKLFKKKEPIAINISASSIPESLGYPVEAFDSLTNALTNLIDEDDKVVTFVQFLNSPNFQNFQLDLSNPNDTLVLGYAFCAALILKRSLRTQMAVNNVLKEFYPPIPTTSPSKSKNN